MDDQRWSMPNWRIRPPPPPPPPHLTHAPPPLPPWTQGLEDLKFGGSQEILQETGTTKNCPRARWNHKMKSYLIELLKEHDTPRYRTQNAWSKEAWKSIVDAFNLKFGLSFASAQVKQKEQDMKKDFRVIKDLLSESGFGWDPDRMMMVAPNDVWAGLRARKNKDALQWQDKSFPYYDDLFALYDGRYAQGRSCRGMDLYAKKATQPSQASTSYSQQLQDPEDNFHSPTPDLPAPGASSMRFGPEEEIGSTNWFSRNDPLDQATSNSPPDNDSAVHALLPDAVPKPACSNEAPHNSMEHPENVRKTH
ncbi:hypothetical protein ACQ4PT_051792 [Festuca glaucescens]